MRLLILSFLEFLVFLFSRPAIFQRCSSGHWIMGRTAISRPAANDGIFSCYKVGCISLLHTSTRIVFFSRACYFGVTGPVTAAQARLVFMLLTEEMAKKKKKKKKKKREKGKSWATEALLLC
ncbi:hypothetical protein IWX91DRAFT_346585, partial [Phyllosticta citricarpa]